MKLPPLLFPAIFPEHMSAKPDKRSWLLGRWEIEDEDTSAIFFITRRPGLKGKITVRAFDKQDGEHFRVTGVRWSGDSLLFETFVPSTMYRARHVLHPISKNRLKQELTLFENWKRTWTPVIFPGKRSTSRQRSKLKKTKSKNL
jgi:hypothetical protein